MPDGAGDHMIKQLESSQDGDGSFVIVKEESKKKSDTQTADQEATADSNIVTQVK